MNLQLPHSNTQEVLYTLIQKGHVSLIDYPHLAGFRTRISELRRKYQINLETVMSRRHNKFGNPFSYAIHKLPESEKNKAVRIYKKLSKC